MTMKTTPVSRVAILEKVSTRESKFDPRFVSGFVVGLSASMGFAWIFISWLFYKWPGGVP